MPKTAMDYSKCCIYKIEHINDESLLYVGHTTNFDKRKTTHKSNCYNKNNTTFNQKLYQMIRESGGWDMFRMIEVEKFKCNDRREAERRENEVMKELKANMNMINSFITEKERKDYKKEYNVINKDKLKEQKQVYYKENNEKFKQKREEYYTANKNKILEKVKEYFDNNKDRILEQRKERITCKCGCVVVKTNLKRHQTSKKHINKMNTIISP